MCVLVWLIFCLRFLPSSVHVLSVLSHYSHYWKTMIHYCFRSSLFASQTEWFMDSKRTTPSEMTYERICLLLPFPRVGAYGYKSIFCFSVYLQYIVLPCLILVCPNSPNRFYHHLFSSSLQLNKTELPEVYL